MKANNNLSLIIAPSAVLIVVSAMFALYGIFPFGDNTISWCDMDQQTIPLLMDLKDILDGKTSILYSTGNAGGMNFWGVFLFFLASPLYITVKFVAKQDIVYLVNILLAVKLALSAFTAAVYLKYSYKSLSPIFSVVLAVMYGCCGYGIMYCQTLVWLDMLALFPLLVLGIERMCLCGKPWLYFICLISAMAINYYISFMLIIYILLTVPLFIRIRCKKEQKKTASLYFILTSFASALVTAPIWLCAFMQVSSSARSGNTLTELAFKPMFDMLDDKLALLMLTALFWAVLPLYFRSPLLKKKTVRYDLITLGILFIPVLFDTVNKLWHTGSYQCFPLRYGFIIVFTMMKLAAGQLKYPANKQCKRSPAAIFLIVLSVASAALSFYIVKTRRSDLMSYINSLDINKKHFKIIVGLFACALLVYIVSLAMYKQGHLNTRTVSLIFSIVFIGEFFLSFSMNIGFASNDGGVLRTSEPLVTDSTDEPYYRTKTEKKYLHVNMLGGLGYNSLAHYTSLTSEDFMFTMKKLGYSSYWMEVGANGGTVLTDALLSIKYSIGAYYDLKSYYDIEKIDGDLKRGTSSICCPVGIISETKPAEMSDLPDEKRVDTQKRIAKRFFGTDSMIHEYQCNNTYNGDFQIKDGKYVITPQKNSEGLCQLRYDIPVKGRQVLYFDLFDRLSNDISEVYYGGVQIYVNGNCLTSYYPQNKTNGIFCLGEFHDTNVQVLVIVNKKLSVRSFGIFGIDTDMLEKASEKLTNQNGCDMYVSKNTITAQCDTDKENSYLYMSIPYEEGLSVQVNGNDEKLLKANGCFCAVKLNKGKNDIKLSFTPKGMKTGIILMLAGVAFILLLKLRLFECLLKSKKLKKTAYVIVSIAGAVSFITICVLPIAMKVLIFFF